MEYIYAALLLHSSGKEITEEGIAKVVKGAGIEPDVAKAKMVVAALQGVNIEEVLKSAAAAPVAVASATAAPAEKKEEKKAEEEKKTEEEAAAGLAGLFG